METKTIIGHLREIRRYWPKAKYAETRREPPNSDSLWIEYAPGRRCSERLFGRYYGEPSGWCGWSVRAERQATISEAMRAAGFGVRPQCAVKGYHFAATRRTEAEVRLIMRNWRASVGRAPTPVERWLGSLYRLPVLVSTQRPSKGARLGKKKRAVVDKARAQF